MLCCGTEKDHLRREVIAKSTKFSPVCSNPSITPLSHSTVFCSNPERCTVPDGSLQRRTKRPHKLKPNTSAWRPRLIQPINSRASDLISRTAVCKLVKWHTARSYALGGYQRPMNYSYLNSEFFFLYAWLKSYKVISWRGKITYVRSHCGKLCWKLCRNKTKSLFVC